MAIETTNVLRESIRYSPVSNTEFNSERLPKPEELEGMELRLRVEPRGDRWERPLQTVVVSLGLMALYSAVWRAAPDSVRWLWSSASSIEGMSVVGGMLAALILLLLLLSVVFVPGHLRMGIVSLSLPLAVSTAFDCANLQAAGFVIVVLLACG